MIDRSLTKWIQYMRQKMPTQASLFASPWFKPFARWFDRPYYWQLNRERAASAVAVGMFYGLMPGPTQMPTTHSGLFDTHTLTRGTFNYAVYESTNLYTFILLCLSDW